MYFPESEDFCAQHPDLRRELISIDRYLSGLVGDTIDFDVMSDILQIEQRNLRRLLALFEEQSILKRYTDLICPNDDVAAELQKDGLVHCDLCGQSYDVAACKKRLVYQVQDRTAAPVPQTRVFQTGYALLIGINQYREHPLAKAAADARALQAVLIDPEYGAYPEDHVWLMTDKQCTKSNINKAFQCLAQATGLDSTVLVFFSGHGFQQIGGFEPGEYLCPVDVDVNSPVSTGISSLELTNALDAIRASRLVVLMDACHSGGIGQANAPGLSRRGGLSTRTYDALAGRGRAILAACGEDEYSYELPGMDNGVFTHYVIEALQGRACDGLGRVFAASLFHYVAGKVTRRCQQQHPYLKYEGETFAILELAPSVRP